jgi:CubicO group peptidase (beta-lactamase class C family)
LKEGKLIAKNLKIAVLLLISLMIISPNLSAMGDSYTSNSWANLDLVDVKSSFPSPVSFNDLDNVTELEAFVDSIIPQQLSNLNIIGATFSAVKNGSIILTKGYGFRKTYPFITVNPNITLFRIGSVSKTFTAIAVLQQVEDGLLDLDEDINEYLTAFKIPDTYSKPITLRHILTHTAGFEEWRIPLLIFEFSDVPSVEELLSYYIPARVHAPGEITSYSNYGFGLAAYIVEQVSGKTFEDYIYDEIAAPLGMNYTSFEQPLPPNLVTEMSTGYDSEGYVQYFENLILPGAGAGSSSAGDIARLMLALMNNGTYDGGRILNNDTVALMFEDQFQPHNSSLIPGVGLGLYELDINYENIIGHEGDTFYFHSGMLMFPEYDFGYFISYNSQNGVYARSQFFAEFIRNYFPRVYTVNVGLPITNNLKDFDGTYLLTRRLYKKYQTTSPHLWLDYKFKIKTNSTCLLFDEIELAFVQYSEDFFKSTADSLADLYIAFIRNEEGEVTHFYSNFFPTVISYEKINPIYLNNPMQLVFAIVIGAVYIIVLAFWGIDGLFKKRRKEEKKFRTDRIFKWSAFGASVTGILPLLYFAIRSQIIIYLAANTAEALGWFIALPYIGTVMFSGLVVLSGISWYEFSTSPRKPKGKEKTTNEDIEIESSFGSNIKKEKPLLKNIQFTVLSIFGALTIVLFSIWRMYGF